MPPGALVQSTSRWQEAGTHILTLRSKVPAGAQIEPAPHAESEVQVPEEHTLPLTETGPQMGASGSG